MHISILTLFPEMFVGPFDHSIIKRALQKNLATIECIHIRDFALDAHKTVDDHPYGGGAGMILKVDIIDRALTHAKALHPTLHATTVLLDPRGAVYTQRTASSFATEEHLILICGHYEGIDERVRSFVDHEISLGDFILTGGELAAMTIVDSIVRLLPGTLHDPRSPHDETHNIINPATHASEPLLEYPQYTKPPIYKGQAVPEVLLSGNHANIATWRYDEAKRRTLAHRPELLKKN